MSDNSLPELSCEIELTPAFYDLDPMAVVWHGHYVKYLEKARCALLDRFDYGYARMGESGYAWPVVDMRLKYVKPARLGQRLTVRAEITEWESRLRIEYLVRDTATGAKLTQAYSIQVAVALASGEMCYVCPPVLLQRLGRTP